MHVDGHGAWWRNVCKQELYAIDVHMLNKYRELVFLCGE